VRSRRRAHALSPRVGRSAVTANDVSKLVGSYRNAVHGDRIHGGGHDVALRPGPEGGKTRQASDLQDVADVSSPALPVPAATGMRNDVQTEMQTSCVAAAESLQQRLRPGRTATDSALARSLQTQRYALAAASAARNAYK